MYSELPLRIIDSRTSSLPVRADTGYSSGGSSLCVGLLQHTAPWWSPKRCCVTHYPHPRDILYLYTTLCPALWRRCCSVAAAAGPAPPRSAASKTPSAASCCCGRWPTSRRRCNTRCGRPRRPLRHPAPLTPCCVSAADTHKLGQKLAQPSPVTEHPRLCDRDARRWSAGHGSSRRRHVNS